MSGQEIVHQAIAYVESPYKEKFAIPRQPGLVTAAQGNINFIGEANRQELARDLEAFSHIWVIFSFHQTAEQGWKPLVRPPRLGGNKKTGVLATRSTFRPNAIGMSVVKLEKVQWQNNQLSLIISGLDLLDKTPVLDIKPYVPYSDALPNANAGFAQQAPTSELIIAYSDTAQSQLTHFTKEFKNLPLLIEQVLAQDPRPAYKRNKADVNEYGMSLYNLNIKWQMLNEQQVQVTAIEKQQIDGEGN